MSSTTSPPQCRVYVDMVADMFHYGHMRFLQKVRAAVEEMGFTPVLVVGITDDQFLAEYKRTPILAQEERCETVRGCRYVDEVIANVSLTTTAEFMDAHAIDKVCHGDDYTEAQVLKWYGPAVERGAYFSVGYSGGVSTTDLIRRCHERFVGMGGALGSSAPKPSGAPPEDADSRSGRWNKVWTRKANEVQTPAHVIAGFNGLSAEAYEAMVRAYTARVFC